MTKGCWEDDEAIEGVELTTCLHMQRPRKLNVLHVIYTLVRVSLKELSLFIEKLSAFTSL